MSESKSMLITIAITLLLFSFVIFLVYLVYCYAYYDEYQIEVYTNKINSSNSKYIYDNMFNDSDLTYDEFNIPYNLMYDKNNLKNIYYLYYKDSGIYKNLEEFIETYYYGDYVVKKEDITFYETGKTNLFKRKKIDYEEVNILSIAGYRSTLGILKDITIEVENNSNLIINDVKLDCHDNKCLLDKIFGGLYKVKYTSNGIDYFGIINVNKDSRIIDITTIDSLVRTSKEKEPVVESEVINENLNIGNYKLSDCFLGDGCPSKSKSYINLYEDGTVDYYTYVTLDIAGDTYHGTYYVSGNFLVLKFASHIYRVHDYDTKQYTDIEGKVDMEMRFKIEDANTIKSDSYRFRYSAE